MRERKTGKELTIVMDNCSGQNKNRMVLRLANYLVEAEYFEKVSFVFLIVGHTKNACDRWFNQLKRNYRRRNIYSFDQLIDSLKTHTNINVTQAKASDFQDLGQISELPIQASWFWWNHQESHLHCRERKQDVTPSTNWCPTRNPNNHSRHAEEGYEYSTTIRLVEVAAFGNDYSPRDPSHQTSGALLKISCSPSRTIPWYNMPSPWCGHQR